MHKRTAQVVIGVFFAAMLTACTSAPAEEHGEICVDEYENRVPDEECDESSSHYRPGRSRRYYSNGAKVPAVGSKAIGGSTVRPATGTITSVPRSGGFGGFSGAGG